MPIEEVKIEKKPLLVPMDLQVCVINKEAQNRSGKIYESWCRRKPDFMQLPRGLSPYPDPFYDDNSKDPDTGVYLHWTLPLGLRHAQVLMGTCQPATLGDRFPAIPDRWLVVRQIANSTNTVDPNNITAWVVESNYQGPHATSSFPNSKQIDSIKLGRQVSLTDWSLATPPTDVYYEEALTAVSAGDPTFLMYQPNTQNITSFYDPLENITTGTLHYCVLGWYSKLTAQDPLVLANCASSDAFATFCQQFFLDPKAVQALPSDVIGNQWVSFGSVYYVDWQLNGDAPRSNQDNINIKDITVTVGATPQTILATLASTTIHTSEAKQKQVLGTSAQNAGLATLTNPDKHRLMLGLLFNLLSTHSDPSDFTLKMTALLQAFHTSPGAVYYHLQPKITAGPTVNFAPVIMTQLMQLNQLSLDDNQNKYLFKQKQQQLYIHWWKLYYLQHNAPQQASLIKQLKIEIQTLQKTIREMDSNNKKARNTIASQETVLNYTLSPDAAVQVTKKSGDVYYSRKDPSLLITGISSPWRSNTPPNQLPVLVEDNLLSEITLLDKTIINLPDVPTTLNISKISFVGRFIQQFLLLSQCPKDQLSNLAIIKDLTQMPYYGKSPWQQPWLPLYLEWKVNWYPLSDLALWQLNKESDKYELKKSPPADLPYRNISGRTMLIPQSNASLASRLQQQLQFSSNTLGLGQSIKTATSDLDILNTNLSGFISQMVCLQNITMPTPAGYATTKKQDRRYLDKHLGASTGQLLGPNRYLTPIPGYLENPNSETKAEPKQLVNDAVSIPFQPIAAGQWSVTDLRIIDQFGQAISIYSSTIELAAPVIVDPSLTPASGKTIPGAALQTTPCVIQPMRLTFHWVESTSAIHSPEFVKSSALLNPEANPIFGWLLLNNMDNSIMVYDAGGYPRCELRFVQTASTFSSAEPDGPVKHPSDYQIVISPIPSKEKYQDSPLLDSWLDSMNQDPGPIENTRLLVLIDLLGQIADKKMMASHGDQQTISSLTGRPFALVRAFMQFDLAEAPYQDPTWYPDTDSEIWSNKLKFLVNFATPEVDTDGFIAYYRDGNYDSLYTHITSEVNGQTYLKPISTETASPNSLLLSVNPPTIPAGKANGETLTLIFDPTKSLHISTGGLLPVSVQRLPDQFVKSPIHNMQVTFRMGPLLTTHYFSAVKEAAANSANQFTLSQTPLSLSYPSGKESWQWLAPIAPSITAKPTATSSEEKQSTKVGSQKKNLLSTNRYITFPLKNPDNKNKNNEASPPEAVSGYLQMNVNSAQNRRQNVNSLSLNETQKKHAEKQQTQGISINAQEDQTNLSLLSVLTAINDMVPLSSSPDETKQYNRNSNKLEKLQIELSEITEETEKVLALMQRGQGLHHSNLDKKYQNLLAETGNIQNQIARLSEQSSFPVTYHAVQSRAVPLVEAKVPSSSSSSNYLPSSSSSSSSSLSSGVTPSSPISFLSGSLSPVIYLTQEADLSPNRLSFLNGIGGGNQPRNLPASSSQSIPGSVIIPLSPITTSHSSNSSP